jgi:hypothetical protein
MRRRKIFIFDAFLRDSFHPRRPLFQSLPTYGMVGPQSTYLLVYDNLQTSLLASRTPLLRPSGVSSVSSLLLTDVCLPRAERRKREKAQLMLRFVSLVSALSNASERKKSSGLHKPNTSLLSLGFAALHESRGERGFIYVVRLGETVPELGVVAGSCVTLATSSLHGNWPLASPGFVSFVQLQGWICLRLIWNASFSLSRNLWSALTG